MLQKENSKTKKSRALRVALRTVHIFSFSVLLGGHWFGIPRTELLPSLYWSVFSGTALMAFEARRGFEWFFKLAGGLTILKLGILSMVPVFWEHSRILLVLAVIIGSAGSHMNSSLRHLDLLPSRKK